MTITRRGIFFLGILILLISTSFLGLPAFWKNFLLFASSIILIGNSVKFDFGKTSKKPPRKKTKPLKEFTDDFHQSNLE